MFNNNKFNTNHSQIKLGQHHYRATTQLRIYDYLGIYLLWCNTYIIQTKNKIPCLYSTGYILYTVVDIGLEIIYVIRQYEIRIQRVYKSMCEVEIKF